MKTADYVILWILTWLHMIHLFWEDICKIYVVHSHPKFNNNNVLVICQLQLQSF